LSLIPPATQAYRISWYAAPTFNYVVLVLGAVLFVTTLVSAGRHRKERKTDPVGARRAVRLAAAVSALTLLFLVSVVVIISKYKLDLFFYGIPASLTAALVLPILTSLLTLGVVLARPRISVLTVRLSVAGGAGNVRSSSPRRQRTTSQLGRSA
jgi:hypothetical protein